MGLLSPRKEDMISDKAKKINGDGFLEDAWLDVLAKSGPGGMLRGALTRWATASPKPLVLLIDEIDSLVGDTLLSVCASCAPAATGARRAFRKASSCAAFGTFRTTGFARVRGR